MPMTDYELFAAERRAADHLRDACHRLLGRLQHQNSDSNDSIPPEWDLREWMDARQADIQEFLNDHKDRRPHPDDVSKLGADFGGEIPMDIFEVKPDRFNK